MGAWKTLKSPGKSEQRNVATRSDRVRKPFNKWVKDLKNKAEKRRGDVFSYGVVSHYRVLPRYFLKHFNTKGQYQNKNIRYVLRSYLKAFMKGFVLVYRIHTDDKTTLLRLFFDFISLCFPKNKVRFG